MSKHENFSKQQVLSDKEIERKINTMRAIFKSHDADWLLFEQQDDVIKTLGFVNEACEPSAEYHCVMRKIEELKTNDSFQRQRSGNLVDESTRKCFATNTGNTSKNVGETIKDKKPTSSHSGSVKNNCDLTSLSSSTKNNNNTTTVVETRSAQPSSDVTDEIRYSVTVGSNRNQATDKNNNDNKGKTSDNDRTHHCQNTSSRVTPLITSTEQLPGNSAAMMTSPQKPAEAPSTLSTPNTAILDSMGGLKDSVTGLAKMLESFQTQFEEKLQTSQFEHIESVSNLEESNKEVLSQLSVVMEKLVTMETELVAESDRNRQEIEEMKMNQKNILEVVQAMQKAKGMSK